MRNHYLVLHVFLLLVSAFSYSSNSTHHHHGMLKPYTGKQLSYTLEVKDIELLTKGKPVIVHKPDAKSDRQGRAAVIQDINAPPHVCMQKILDFTNYPKYVPLLKSIDIYHSEKYENGTEVTAAFFSARVLAVKFGYYLRLVRHPMPNTVTWTLDYDHKSDFDDNVGQWQVMAHPTKRQWTRVLYSTGVALPKIIPTFVVNYVLKTVLVEATTWLKKEAEGFVRVELTAGRNVFDASAPSPAAGAAAGLSWDSFYYQQGTGIYNEDRASGTSSYVPIGDDEGVGLGAMDGPRCTASSTGAAEAICANMNDGNHASIPTSGEEANARPDK